MLHFFKECSSIHMAKLLVGNLEQHCKDPLNLLIGVSSAAVYFQVSSFTLATSMGLFSEEFILAPDPAS